MGDEKTVSNHYGRPKFVYVFICIVALEVNLCAFYILGLLLYNIIVAQATKMRDNSALIAQSDRGFGY